VSVRSSGGNTPGLLSGDGPRPLLALSRHATRVDACPLSGVKRAYFVQAPMSACERVSPIARLMVEMLWFLRHHLPNSMGGADLQPQLRRFY